MRANAHVSFVTFDDLKDIGYEDHVLETNNQRDLMDNSKEPSLF